MADISAIKLPDNTTYNLKDNFMTYNRIIPLQSKTYTGVVASGNSDPAGWYYFGWLKPTDYNTPWRIRYRMKTTIAGLSSYQHAYFDVQMGGMQDGYHNFEIRNIQNGSYRAIYAHVLYTCKTAGITNGYGPLIGVRFQSAYNPATAANSRTFEIQILETINCTFTFFDNFTLYANVPGTGTTNYANRYGFDGTSNGYKIYGDANDPNYQNRIYYGRWKTYTALYRYQLLLQKDQDYLLPINAVNNDVGTSKTLTTLSFDPFGIIVYWASTNTYSANAIIGDGGMYNQHHNYDTRYSFNTGTTLASGDNIYIAAVPQGDGKAKLDSTPLVKTLPSTEDGKIYIFLGKAINTYQVDFYPYHPIYYYKNGRIRYYTKQDANQQSFWQYNSSTDSIDLIFPS